MVHVNIQQQQNKTYLKLNISICVSQQKNKIKKKGAKLSFNLETTNKKMVFNLLVIFFEAIYIQIKSVVCLRTFKSHPH